MGTYISLHGRMVGYDSDNAKLQRPGVSSSYEDEEGLSAASTASNIKLRGTTTLGSSSAKDYTMNAPGALDTGIRKTLTTTTTSTAARTVSLASGTFQTTVGTSAQKITFNGIGQNVELVALSTSLVGVRSFTSGVTFST